MRLTDLPADVLCIDRRFVERDHPAMEIADADRLGDLVEILRDALDETLLAFEALCNETGRTMPAEVATFRRKLVDGEIGPA